MGKRVLDVGQCDPDHGTIRNYLKQHFPEVELDRAHLLDDALEKLRAGEYHLVLVNRKLDQDYSDGIEIIKQIKSDDELREVPVMLVTNYPDHQQAAVEVGALHGFGKLEYDKPETKEKLRAVLGA